MSEAQQEADPRVFFTSQTHSETNQFFSFHFPPIWIFRQKFETQHEIRNRLHHLAFNMGLTTSVPFSYIFLIQGAGRSVKLYCKFCSKACSWQLQTNIFVISKFSNEHIHKRSSIVTLRIQDSLSEKFINQRIRKESLIKQVIYGRRRQQKETQDLRIKEQLSFFIEKTIKLGYNIATHQQKQKIFPDVFIATNQFMRDSYIKNWETVWFKTNDRNEMKQKEGFKWRFGLFMGFDSKFDKKFFAISLISRPSVENYMNLLWDFIALHGKCPLTFVIPNIKNLKNALKELKKKNLFTGHYLVEPDKFLRQISQKVKPDVLNYYTLLTLVKNKQQFQYLLEQLRQKETNILLLESFCVKAQHYCYSHLPNQYFGIDCMNSIISKFSVWVLKRFRIGYNPMCLFLQFHQFFRNFKSMKRKGIKQSKRFSRYFENHGLEQLGERLASKVFYTFIINYSKLTKLSVEQLAETDSQNKYIVSSLFYKQIVKKLNYFFECDCGYTIKAGLPCEHILKVMVYQGETNYLDYINPRWILPVLIQGVDLAKRGRPRRSRKNMMN